MAKRDLIEELRRRRHTAMDNPDRVSFMKRCVLTNEYLAGRQAPSSASTIYDDEGDTRDHYHIVNFMADIVDRITAMIAAGRLDFQITRKTDAVDDLVKMARIILDDWKDSAHLQGRVYESISDMVKYGVGALRMYVDPTRDIERGGFIGLESVFPGQIIISPTARDPFHPLLGSEYIIYETVHRRGQLKEMYPEHKNDIDKLGPFDMEAANADEQNPLYLRTRNAGIAGIIGPSEYVGADDTDPDDDLIVWSEYIHERIEMEDVLEVRMPVRKWYRCALLGAVEADQNTIIVEKEEEIPTNMPPFILFTSWLRTDSAWGVGAPTRMFDLQDIFNVFISSLVKEIQIEAAWKGRKLTRAGILDEDDRAAFMNGETDLLEIDPKGEFRDVPLNQLWGDAGSDSSTDFSKRTAVMNTIIELMRTVSGTYAPVLGDVDVEKRVSGVALNTAQQAVMIAQEAIRHHINAQMKNLGNLAWETIKFHRIVPFSIPSADGGPMYNVNARTPANEATATEIEQMQTSGKYDTPEGMMIPTSFHAVSAENDELVLPINSEQEIVDTVDSGGYDEYEFGFNTLSVLDFDVKVVIDSEYAQKADQRRQLMAWAANVRPGFWSATTLMKEAKRDDPDWSIEAERAELMTDELAATVNEAAKRGPQAVQMAMQMVQQALQQMDMQQQAQANGVQGAEAGQREGAPPMPEAPGVGAVPQ